jgi:Archaeal fructose-1,6-bisphosphatase and related enzymes of inositol monophosphatase family
MKSISPNLNIMIKTAEKASKVLIRDFGELENLQVSKKGPKDFVTNSDKKVEKIILEELEKTKKKFSFLSEENGKIENQNKENVWIIDPIDGTNNFLHGIPHFSISIGLKSNDEIIAGVIFDPIKNELFYAEKNNGAYFNNQRIRVSKKNNIEECLFASNNVGINNKNLSIRNLGSAALDMAYVGTGRFDGYFQNDLHIWDIAAGIIIVKEAGGMVNNLNLSQIENLKIRASSNAIYEKMLEKIK